MRLRGYLTRGIGCTSRRDMEQDAQRGRKFGLKDGKTSSGIPERITDAERLNSARLDVPTYSPYMIRLRWLINYGYYTIDNSSLLPYFTTTS